jgi:DNA-binding NtrC family response regulator/pSer/pThr/pTyr-binding forkhead associated (FHA) protein
MSDRKLSPIDVPTEFEPATALDVDVQIVPRLGKRVYLLVRDDEGTRVVDVPEGRTILFGRTPDAGVRIDDTRASRRHAQVQRVGEEIVVTDLGSRNGTKVNGRRLRDESATVTGGDVIRIGGTEAIVATAEGRSHGTEGDHVGGRLDGEIARVVKTGGRATLARIDIDLEIHEDPLASIAERLGSMDLVEERGEGEYAVLLEEDDSNVAQERLRAVEAPGIVVTWVRIPDQGTRAADLWARTRGGATEAVVTDTGEGVVVADASMVEVFELGRKLAAVQTTVLILGETGVGKEVIAEQIHRWSDRASSPFVRLNCASLPETLLESELFGHERGAFTGADRRKIGYMEAAQGGTLFLDEIGELPLTVQVKLLNVLENREVRRLGGTQELPIDVRVISATHRDLQAEVQASRFREDLFYRLSAFTLNVPPLRERQAEIALLAEMFARDASRRAHRDPPTIDGTALAALVRHPWPGNVRELRNAMEHAVVLADQGRIGIEHLPESIRRRDAALPSSPSGVSVKDKLASLEKRSLEEALRAENGNQTRAAKRLGLSRRALIYKMEKYGLKRS